MVSFFILRLLELFACSWQHWNWAQYLPWLTSSFELNSIQCSSLVGHFLLFLAMLFPSKCVCDTCQTIELAHVLSSTQEHMEIGSKVLTTFSGRSIRLSSFLQVRLDKRKWKEPRIHFKGHYSILDGSCTMSHSNNDRSKLLPLAWTGTSKVSAKNYVHPGVPS